MDLEFKKLYEEVVTVYLEKLATREKSILSTWLRKLKKAKEENQELKNWREIRNEYISLMNGQLRRSDLMEPFTDGPAKGPLHPVPKKVAYTKMKFTLCE